MDKKNTYFGYQSKRQRLELLRAQLQSERTSFESHWKALSEFVLPRRQRFFTSDSNRGDRRNQKIVDSTATLAARTLRSGMMGGVTSPARRWFRLTTPDPDMAEMGPVKLWLETVTQRMNSMFLRSNLYNVLPTIYGDMGVFGTAAIQVEEDFESVFRFYSHPIGSYWLANNDKLTVDTFQRDFRMTVRQMVDKFGREKPSQEIDWSVFSDYIKSLYDEGLQETWIDVCHIVKPNEEHDPTKLNSKYKKFMSCYYELGSNVGKNYLTPNDSDRYLSEKGYDYFPVLCPRWEITGEDVYGTNCPGMEALGDIQQLMLGERRTMQAVEKQINPPMVGPTTLKTSSPTILPGGITYHDVRDGMQGFRPAHEVNFNIQQMEEKQSQVRQRISRTFYEDLFLMLANSDRREITAREIDERHEEKLLALGPVLEQLNQDLLDPLIDICFDLMNKYGQIPLPPEELHGMPLKVEYESVLAQAQKSLGVGSVERFTQFVGNMAGVSPAVLDKIDADQIVDVYGDLIGISPSIIRTDDAVEEIRMVRAKQQQAQQMSEQIAQGAGAAKDLSQAKLDEPSALSELLQRAKAGS